MSRSSILLARLLFGTLLFMTLIFSQGYGWVVWVSGHILAGIAAYWIFVWNNPSPKERRRNPEHEWTIRNTIEVTFCGVMGFAILLIFSTMPELEPEPVVVRK